MRHALFVAFHFPPEASSSGVLRTLKFVRYLPERGWRVSVITAERSAYEVQDPGLESQVPEGTRVIRTRCPNTKREWSWRGVYPALLALPDVWIGWMPHAVRAGRELIARDPVDVVYSTSPHATAHLIGGRLARAAQLPWITDFRDPWIEDPPEPGAPSGPVFTTVNRWLERRTVRDASAVVSSTPRLRELFRQRYPDERDTKLRVILNGYDEADFQGRPIAPMRSGPRLRIAHAGSINADFRDPRPLFESIARLIREGLVIAPELDIRFIGGGAFGESPDLQAAIARSGLRDAVTLVPRVPYEASLQELGAADLLLLLQASDDTVGLVPAKLYEYLRAQKPTLALVREGAVSDVMAHVGGGFAADPAMSANLDEALRAILREWRAGTLGRNVASVAALQRYDRRALTGELAELFDEASATR